MIISKVADHYLILDNSHMPTYKGILASSVDSSQLSLTVESFSKFLIGLIGWYAVSKGFNALAAQTQLQVILDIVAQSIPIAFTLWNAMLMIWGLTRKLFTYFSSPPNPVLDNSVGGFSPVISPMSSPLGVSTMGSTGAPIPPR